jgi:RNA polymerase sigma-70 factor (ECF subfamily)
MPAYPQLAQVIEQEFSVGREHYGNIGLSIPIFQDYVQSIVCKHLGASPQETVAIEFAKKLYMRDLYLACGCVQKDEAAWRIMDTSYRKFVTDLVRFCYRNGTDAEEVADFILVSLYLPDRSGRHRIASYDGRSSLPTWLRVIVVNRAINEKHNARTTKSDTIPEIPDRFALASIELTLRAQRYQKVLKDSLTQAFQELSPRERLMLLWRYEEDLQLGEMAKLLGIHQSNVTRQLLRLQGQLKERIIAILSLKHKMSSAAIQECLADIVENPHHSISLVALIRETPKPALTIAYDPRADKLYRDRRRGA